MSGSPTTTLGLHFGALSPTIETQLKEQGLYLDHESVDHCQKDANAITRLMVRGLIPMSVAEKARKKLVNVMGKEVKWVIKQ